MDARKSSQGTSAENWEGNRVSKNAPRHPPRMLEGISSRSQFFAPVRWFLTPHAPASDPGKTARVLVVFAITRISFPGRPGNTAPKANCRDGKVSNVPPPAMEFTNPATSAAIAQVIHGRITNSGEEPSITVDPNARLHQDIHPFCSIIHHKPC